jgi:NAD(P)-dependent dehydrogenase (short-subunit alcohol dehydrogenase family)
MINVASVAGWLGFRDGAAYTISKHASIGHTRNIAAFYGSHGERKNRANAIAPGSFSTGMATSDPSDLDTLGMETYAYLGEYHTGTPENIANVALLLASDDASFVNGEIISVGAGWTVR